MKSISLLAILFLLSTSPGNAAEQPLKDDWDRINYSLGHQIGSDLKRQGTAANPDQLASGIEDALAGREPRLTREEMDRLLAAVKQKIIEDKRREIAGQSGRKQELKEKYRGEGRDFLAANGNKPGVVSLPSGLQYKVISDGSGKTPGPGDTVSVRYRGTLIDGTEFGGNLDGPAETYRVDAVIPAWTEALQMMKEGGKWQLFVPADLAFGERGPLADRTVIYELELLTVETGK